MRIIGGVYKGKRIDVVKGLPVRPTTDFAKEGLFNILNNKLELKGAKTLDLFCGTGNISLELASRGAEVTSVDANFKCVKFVGDISRELKLNLFTVKNDVFKFLKSQNVKYDLIFADPPYDLENMEEIHKLVFENKLLKENGLLIIEHGPKTKLENLLNFSEHRKYGNVNFSFFIG